jgi:glucose/arabinose dehydrogenase
VLLTRSLSVFAFIIVQLLAAPQLAAAQLRTELVADGFVRPVAIVPDPLVPGRLIVAEFRGLLWVIQNGRRLPTPFLDLTSQVQHDNIEQGLLGVAFHPAGDRVFVSFSKKPTPTSPPDAVGDTALRRYRRLAGNDAVLDPASATDILVIPQIRSVHRGGDLHFLTPPSGSTRLFMSVGDGGAFADPVGNAQDPQSLRGKMLRLDVEVADTHPVGYVVPADNPFIDGQPVAARGEIWSFGFRNPWRFSFDDIGADATGAMIIGDVGEVTREEIDYEPFGQGGRNYGWFVREGTVPTPNVAGEPSYGPLTEPLGDYPRDIGRAVTGGFVYRGSALPAHYRERYFFADFFGRVFSLGLAIGGGGEARVMEYIEHTAELGNPQFISTFGRDLAGELYITTFRGGTNGTARILKIVPAPDIAPAAPGNLRNQVAGSTVLLEWDPSLAGGSALGFQIEAGSQEGLADLLVTRTPLASMVAHGVADGSYFVRVRAFNDRGLSEASNETTVQVGCVGPVAAPAGLAATVGHDRVVSVAWNAVTGAESYVLLAGTEPNRTDLVIPVAGTAVSGPVGPGTYYARVYAVNARCGNSAPSAEIVVVVP